MSKFKFKTATPSGRPTLELKDKPKAKKKVAKKKKE